MMDAASGILFVSAPDVAAVVLIAEARDLIAAIAPEVMAVVETEPASGMLLVSALAVVAAVLIAEASGIEFVRAPAETPVVLIDPANVYEVEIVLVAVAVVLTAPARFTVFARAADVAALTEMSEARATVLPASDENGAWENAEMPNIAIFYSSAGSGVLPSSSHFK
jgi:hypothetical protein